MGTLHVPVLLEEALELLRPATGAVIADLTLGGGGYAEALLRRGATVIGLDRDAAALERCRTRLAEFGDRFRGEQRAFGQFGGMLDEFDQPQVDGICMDLGLSSDQLDDPGRGFAFRLEGPLDLRMDPRRGRPASEQLAEAREEEIAGWLRDLGEVRAWRRLARVLHARLREAPLESTSQLRDLLLEQLPRHQRPEPELARVFQALRILVNDELGQLDEALAQVPERLRPGGRFVAVSYHSLEDRRVKQMLRRESGEEGRSRHLPVDPRPARMRPLNRRAIRPGEAEIARNPRARSARLRAGERLP